jgi:hypothetical protein
MESAKPPMFEDLLDTVGHFGLYQIRIYLILTFMDISNSQCMLFYVFGNVIPDWTCLTYEGLGNVTSLLNRTSSNSTNGTDPFKGLCTYEGAKCEAFHYDGRLKTIVTEVSFFIGSPVVSLYNHVASVVRLQGTFCNRWYFVHMYH